MCPVYQGSVTRSTDLSKIYGFSKCTHCRLQKMPQVFYLLIPIMIETLSAHSDRQDSATVYTYMLLAIIRSYAIAAFDLCTCVTELCVFLVRRNIQRIYKKYICSSGLVSHPGYLTTLPWIFIALGLAILSRCNGSTVILFTYLAARNGVKHKFMRCPK